MYSFWILSFARLGERWCLWRLGNGNECMRSFVFICSCRYVNQVVLNFADPPPMQAYFSGGLS